VKRGERKRLIVPLVLAVTVVGGIAAAVSSTTACGTSSPKPHVDGGTGDGPSDVPII
jgi:hypothetical protein